MSNPLFEFVKVAAGTAFPFETGTFYSHFDDTPKEFWMSRIDKGSVQHKDIYILRPAESPDAGREGLYTADIEFGNNLPRPIPADPGSQVEAVDPAKLLEWINEKYLVFEKGSEQYLITLYKQSL